MAVCVCLLATLWSVHASGSEGRDCSTIEDADERLSCYDRQYSREPASDEPASPATMTEIETMPVTGQSAAETTVEDVAPAAAAAEGAGPESEEQRTFFGSEKLNLTSTIAAIRAGEKQKMVFRLENAQIWIQATPRPLPFREGDTVTIKNAFFGGYFMRSEKGTSTRVQRIQ